MSKPTISVTPHKGILLAYISHNRAKKKGVGMLIFISGIAVFLAYRAVRAAVASLQALPRSNEDWIWY